MRKLFPTTACAAALLTLPALAIPAMAIAQQATAPRFEAPARDFAGSVRFSAATAGSPITPGSQVQFSGQGFTPGAQVQLSLGNQPLTQAQVANAQGEISGQLAIPADAATGLYPVAVTTSAPYGAVISELKVSPAVPVMGTERLNLLKVDGANGLYQTAYSPKHNTLFAASAVGRPPVTRSELLKLDADSLTVLERMTPAEAPDRTDAQGRTQDGGLFAVYGVGVDDAHDNVWITNTRQNTVAVYRQSDLGLVHQFAPGTVNHARDVVVYTARNKAFASATLSPDVVVFDTKDVSVSKAITIQTGVRGKEFSAASLSLDPAAGRLYVASHTTNEVAIIDTATDQVLKVMPVPGARNAIGISHDARTGRIFVASQDTDNLVALDGNTGQVIFDTPVGAGALNVVYDPQSRLAFVSSRGSNSFTAVDERGTIVANIDGAPQANHVAIDGRGNVYGVTRGRDEAGSNQIWRLTPAP